MTSPLKQLTDSAEQLRQAALIAKYEPIAKHLTDTAKQIKAHQEKLEVEYDYSQNAQEVTNEQNEILSEEQNEALEQASEVASESLNAGNSNTTYIDPNETPSDEANATEPEKKVVKRSRRVRKDIKKFNGDPWDYY